MKLTIRAVAPVLAVSFLTFGLLVSGCSDDATPIPVEDPFAVSEQEKVEILTAYAPRVWMHGGEDYYPSSVEWSFNFLRRSRCCKDALGWDHCGQDLYGLPEGTTMCDDLRVPGVVYWLVHDINVAGILPGADGILDFFRGCDGVSTGMACSLSEAPVYAFWAEKAPVSIDDAPYYVDLIYFFWYPFNLGKQVVGQHYGNHIGDWEHVSIRLRWTENDQAEWLLQPTELYAPAHGFGFNYDWEEVEKVDGGTHPVIASALGSHGSYNIADPAIERCRSIDEMPVDEFGLPIPPPPGEEQRFYHENCITEQDCASHLYASPGLRDFVCRSQAWDTWYRIETYNFNLKQGLGSSMWPRWMNNDYDHPGDTQCGPPEDPNCGAVYRWGTPRRECNNFGYCILESGPTGPIDKSVWEMPLR